LSSSDDFKVKGKQQNKESELYIWVINPTGEVTFRSSDLKPLWQQQNILLADLVNSSREAIGVRGRGLEVVAKVDGASQGERFQQLHQLLIEPIADLLAYHQHLGKSRNNCLASRCRTGSTSYCSSLKHKAPHRQRRHQSSDCAPVALIANHSYGDSWNGSF
jgi:hypothetical protein